MLVKIFRLMSSIAFVGLAAAAPLPTITSGQITTPTVAVAKPPAAPKIVLDVQGSPAFISFTWTGPSGEAFSQLFRGGPWVNRTIFQGTDPLLPESTAGKNVFGLYTEAGKWTLTQIYLCSAAGCTTYDSGQLATFFNSQTIEITNKNTADITAPAAETATIKTPTVSISSAPNLLIDVMATDNLSGISQVEVDARPPQSFNTISAYVFQDSSIFLKGTLHLTGMVQPGTQTGVYTVMSVSLRDVAGNLATITDPAAISTLFGGSPTFQVTN